MSQICCYKEIIVDKKTDDWHFYSSVIAAVNAFAFTGKLNVMSGIFTSADLWEDTKYNREILAHCSHSGAENNVELRFFSKVIMWYLNPDIWTRKKRSSVMVR